MEEHAKWQSERGGGGTADARSDAQRGDSGTAEDAAGPAHSEPAVGAAAARGAAKAERRRQAQGKLSRRDALQTRAKVREP